MQQQSAERGGGERMTPLIAIKYPHVLYDDSATWRVWTAILLSTVPHCLVSGRWFSPKAKGDHPNRNRGICSQP